MSYQGLVAYSYLLILLWRKSCEESQILNIQLSDVKPNGDEQYLCKSLALPEKMNWTLTAFSPNATNAVHHMILHGCALPGSIKPVWNCGEMTKASANSYERAPVCDVKSRVEYIYAWAHHAPAFQLPSDVGFKIGGVTGITYLVLQVHYRDDFRSADTSALSIQMTDSTLSKTAGVLLSTSMGFINAKSKERFDITCPIPEESLVLHPFAFRVHTHNAGVLVRGYRVRNKTWSLLGEKSPQLPQVAPWDIWALISQCSEPMKTFYPISNQSMTLIGGDVVASTCEMVNNEDHRIYIGPKVDNEMCNFYLMYWVNGQRILQKGTCISSGPPSYYWITDLENVPL